MNNPRYKERENQQEQEGAGLDLDIPDISQALANLDNQITTRELVAKEHVAQMEKDEEDVKKGKRKPRQKPKGGTICFCGNPHCNIGEFVETQGE